MKRRKREKNLKENGKGGNYFSRKFPVLLAQTLSLLEISDERNRYMFVCTEKRANMLNAELLTIFAKVQIKILSMYHNGAKQSHLHHS